jgi:hypothetical protein
LVVGCLLKLILKRFQQEQRGMKLQNSKLRVLQQGGLLVQTTYHRKRIEIDGRKQKEAAWGGIDHQRSWKGREIGDTPPPKSSED